MLSFDENSQIHALNRTQPGLPMRTGRAGMVKDDCKRHGTTTLFAAFNTLDVRAAVADKDAVMECAAGTGRIFGFSCSRIGHACAQTQAHYATNQPTASQDLIQRIGPKESHLA